MSRAVPYTATVNAQGIAVVTVTPGSNVVNSWKVFQIGFALGQLAASPQVAAFVNGLPLTVAPLAAPAAFASIPGLPPYAMGTFFVGPPYVILDIGDQLICAVLGATPGDTFTAGVFYEEVASDASMGA